MAGHHLWQIHYRYMRVRKNKIKSLVKKESFITFLSCEIDSVDWNKNRCFPFTFSSFQGGGVSEARKCTNHNSLVRRQIYLVSKRPVGWRDKEMLTGYGEGQIIEGKGWNRSRPSCGLSLVCEGPSQGAALLYGQVWFVRGCCSLIWSGVAREGPQGQGAAPWCGPGQTSIEIIRTDSVFDHGKKKCKRKVEKCPIRWNLGKVKLTAEVKNRSIRVTEISKERSLYSLGLDW